MGPMVFFHCGRVSTAIPSTKQPPGQRTKAGLRSPIIWARSRRRLFGRFLKVRSGNNETKSSQTVPVEPKVRTNRALASEPFAVSRHSYLRHASPDGFLK